MRDGAGQCTPARVVLQVDVIGLQVNWCLSGNRRGATPMNRWHGKLLGAVIGAVLLRSNPLLGALIGLLLGHAFDTRWRNRHDGPQAKAAGGDPYATLGVPADASDAAVEQAYRRLISRHHPDRLGDIAGEARRQSEARAGEINRAYDRIKTLRKRQ